MSRLLLLSVILLAAGCSRDPVDPAEITWVFNRHSCDKLDLVRMEQGLKTSGPEVLPSFDPYAFFLPPQWKPAPAMPGVKKAHAGLVLWRSGGAAWVVKVYPGSPAEKAGLKAGDRVSLFDGRPVGSLSDGELQEDIYGVRGGGFSLKGVSASGAPVEASLKRDFGGMQTVWGFIVPGTRTGYLRIVNFGGKAAERIKTEMNALLDGGANRVVIDLRGNYGGPVQQTSDALALFAPRGGPVFRAVSRHPGYSRVFAAAEPGPYAGVKTVVLADAGTISRGELFAAALREWGGASVVGETTGGNVSATRGFRLKSGAALRLTVARLETPSGADLDGKGLVPDVAVQDRTTEEGAGLREFPQALASADPVLKRALELH